MSSHQGESVTLDRLLVRVCGTPAVATGVALAVVGLIALLLASALPAATQQEPGGDMAPVEPTALYELPKPQTRLDPVAARSIHRSLHRVGEACAAPTTDAKRTLLARQVRRIERIATQHPGAAFTIDDERGSILSLLFVLRHELEDCDPALVSRVDDLIPPAYR